MKSTMLARFFRFGQVDPVDAQLQELERQGATMARIAHLCASLLVVLFSAGSLVALGSDALSAILQRWASSHQLDIPSTITVCVSTLMVLAMDVAMLQAASMLRLLSSRRAGIRERILHIAVMATVAALESGTYWYMSATYEHPSTAAASALIVARALAAPLLAVYLSMSRVLPITSRDILAQVELAAGAGVLRDVSLAANDRTAPLDQKMRLYSSAAIMSAPDRARLSGMIEAVGTNTPTLLLEPSDSALVKPQEPLQLEGPSHPDPRPPTGPGSPSALPVRTPERKTQEPIPIRRAPERRSRKTAARSKQNAEARVRSTWHPGITISQLERAAGVSRSTAHKWNRVLIGEQEHQAVQ